MGVSMNKDGHPQTLVAAQRGNSNAVTFAVFSPRSRSDRVREWEAAIADRPGEEVVAAMLRRELAAVAALGDALDDAIADKGVLGRRGEPRTLVSLRLLQNEKLCRTLQQYASATTPGEAGQWWPKGAFMITPATVTKMVGLVVDVALNYIDRSRQEQFLREAAQAVGGDLPE
jgi:hypothetical protein